MKTTLLFFILLLFVTIALKAQEVCTTPEDNAVDLNIISVNKCEIVNKKQNSRERTTKALTARNRIKKIRKTPQKNQSSLSNPSKVSIVTTNNDLSIKTSLKSQTKELLFSVVEQVPLFPKCKNSSNEKAKKCFKDNMQKHFSKNYYPEVFSEEGIRGRVLIQFTIDVYGKPKNIQVVSSKPSKVITNEINRIINKLPQLESGKEKGIPVNVTYSFPINLILN
ncbi:TonB family protein [Tenacibaculum sp. 1_MG-2023]|uniref:TonB family protein n=1 Tax=Tenacibaculum sp. 1_MG-2023 TaxID=3062653 RepID=UPI0026E3FE8E|nr:TonB family protein [Tenacibaculum sp. 1_MG-2023]MDO6676070.1 TonB family protein [Tenacibaculum sp. 1_MG-2023]